MAGQVGIVDQIVGITHGFFRAVSEGFNLLKIVINLKDPKTDEYLNRISDLQASENYWFTMAMVLGAVLITLLCCFPCLRH